MVTKRLYRYSGDAGVAGNLLGGSRTSASWACVARTKPSRSVKALEAVVRLARTGRPARLLVEAAGDVGAFARNRARTLRPRASPMAFFASDDAPRRAPGIAELPAARSHAPAQHMLDDGFRIGQGVLKARCRRCPSRCPRPADGGWMRRKALWCRAGSLRITGRFVVPAYEVVGHRLVHVLEELPASSFLTSPEKARLQPW